MGTQKGIQESFAKEMVFQAVEMEVGIFKGNEKLALRHRGKQL